jgi:hypothetical protein
MNFKAFTIALSVSLLATAVLASSAVAGSPVTKKSSWLEGSTKLTIPRTVQCSKTSGTENFIIKGTLLGAETEIRASGIECSAMTIFNETTSGVNMAKLTGRFTLTGVKVAKPSGCTVSSEMVQTNPITGDVVMDSAVSAQSYLKFEADPLMSEKWADIKISGCAIAGTYPLKGTSYCLLTNQTGVNSNVQECAHNFTTGLMGSWLLGGKPATFSGEITFQLVNGAVFGLQEI